jgi:ketosteroid isomerase-like protein
MAAPATATHEIEQVLDQFHQAAAKADGATYFGLFAPEGVFLGTDASERWTVEEFKAYAAPHFAKGQGWTYVSTARHVALAPAGDVAWFDELLTNKSYGVCRGTGVLRRIGAAWRISQYHLTIPVPNQLADKVVAMIRDRPGTGVPGVVAKP